MREADERRRSWWQRLPRPVRALGAVAAAAAAVVAFGVVWWKVPFLLYATVSREDVRIKAITDTRTALLAGLAALGALGTFWLNGRVYRITARTFEVTERGHVTDRYSKAIEQLGNDSLDVRLGGIYALEQIARDSARGEEDQATIVEVLSAFVRVHSDPVYQYKATHRARSLEGYTEEEIIEKAVDALEKSTKPPVDVQAAVTVLGRLPPREGVPRADLAGATLKGANLSGADLRGAKLREAKLSRANLSKANLGPANPSQAELAERLSQANPRQARIFASKIVSTDLNGADLTGANLTWANLSWANLTLANLDPAKVRRAKPAEADPSQASPSHAEIPEWRPEPTNLEGADLRHAELFRAHLLWADLRGADLRRAKLHQAALAGAKLHRALLAGAIFNATMLVGRSSDSNEVSVQGLTQEQLDQAEGEYLTLLPAGLHQPKTWHSGPAQEE